MVEISTESMKRTEVRHDGGRVFQISASISGLRENSPPPAGMTVQRRFNLIGMRSINQYISKQTFLDMTTRI